MATSGFFEQYSNCSDNASWWRHLTSVSCEITPTGDAALLLTVAALIFFAVWHVASLAVRRRPSYLPQDCEMNSAVYAAFADCCSLSGAIISRQFCSLILLELYILVIDLSLLTQSVIQLSLKTYRGAILKKSSEFEAQYQTLEEARDRNDSSAGTSSSTSGRRSMWLLLPGLVFVAQQTALGPLAHQTPDNGALTGRKLLSAAPDGPANGHSQFVVGYLIASLSVFFHIYSVLPLLRDTFHGVIRSRPELLVSVPAAIANACYVVSTFLQAEMTDRYLHSLIWAFTRASLSGFHIGNIAQLCVDADGHRHFSRKLDDEDLELESQRLIEQKSDSS